MFIKKRAELCAQKNNDVVKFFSNLSKSDWDVSVTKKWQVKDVLAHLVGWEREVTKELPKVFATNKDPWFILTKQYDDYNEKIYQEFKDYTPEQLIAELEKWQDLLDKEIQKIGEENIRQRAHIDWVFDDGGEPHSEHHIRQIKKVLP